MQLVLHSQYPAQRFSEARRRSVGLHRRPPGVTQTSLPSLLPPFAMWTAFPSPDYYGGSAPCPTPQVTAPLPADVLAARRGGQTGQGSHVHCVSIGGVGAQLCSGSIATSTPQTFLVASRTGVNSRPGSRLPVHEVGVHCSPAQICQIRAGSTITEVPPLVHSRYTFPPCSPDPDHLAVLARPGFVRAASHPPQRFLDQAALNFDPAAATARTTGVSHPRSHTVRSTRGALPVLLLVGFPCRLPNPACTSQRTGLSTGLVGLRASSHVVLGHRVGIWAPR